MAFAVKAGGSTSTSPACTGLGLSTGQNLVQPPSLVAVARAAGRSVSLLQHPWKFSIWSAHLPPGSYNPLGMIFLTFVYIKPKRI